jgi:hypothetical protein
MPERRSCDGCCVYSPEIRRDGKRCPFYLSKQEARVRDAARARTDKVLAEQVEAYRRQK